MPHEFRKHEYLRIADLERCPYVWGTPECGEWNREKDHRDLLNALDRYAQSLVCDHMIVKIESDSGIYQQCMECGRMVTIYYSTDTGSAGDTW